MKAIDYRGEIPRLVAIIEDRIDSLGNQRRRSCWDAGGMPPVRPKKIPVTVSPELQMWAHLHKISLVDFYQVPEVYVYGQLKTKLFAFDNFADDAPLDRSIWMWLGTPFEGSLFGLPCEFLQDFEPEDKGATLYSNCREASEQIEQPDFFHSGLMPLAHRLYAGCRELLPESYELLFPDYIQTPLATASHLIGTEQFLIQAVDDPEGARQFLKRLLAIRVGFRKERAAFLGTEFGCGIYDNDHVCTPMVSPNLYRELIWPVENELAALEGGIDYWHSCGNTTQMLDWIKKLPLIGLQHISAWTDRRKASEIIDKNQALQVCVHPLRDVLQATDEQIEKSLMEIIDTLGHHRIKIDADCFQTFLDMPEQIKRIQHWISIAQKVTSKDTV